MEASQSQANGAPNSESPFTLKENILRTIWILIGSTLFRFSFHNWYLYRSIILKLFGSRIDKNVRIRRTARIEMPWKLTIGKNSAIGDYAVIYNQSEICIGKNATISQYSHLCTGSHVYSVASFIHFSKPIVIEDYAWVASNAFVGPGVRISEGAILGACAVTMHNLEAWTIYAGNPSKVISKRNNYSFKN